MPSAYLPTWSALSPSRHHVSCPTVRAFPPRSKACLQHFYHGTALPSHCLNPPPVVFFDALSMHFISPFTLSL